MSSKQEKEMCRTLPGAPSCKKRKPKPYREPLTFEERSRRTSEASMKAWARKRSRERGWISPTAFWAFWIVAWVVVSASALSLAYCSHP